MTSRTILAAAIAAALLLTACEDDATRAERYYTSALALMAEDDVDRAMVELRNVFQYDGFHKQARQLYADTLVEQGNLSEAYAQYLRLIEQYPDTLAVRQTLAEIAAQNGNWDEVDRHGEAAIALAPEDPRSRAIGALLAYRTATLDADEAAKSAAVAEARAVLAELPTSLPARRIVIDAIVDGRTPTAALPEIDRALQINPDSLEFNILKFRILATAGREEDAGAQLERTYELFPDNEEVRATLVSWYLSRRDLDAAEALLRQLAGPPDGPISGHMIVVQFLVQARGVAAAQAELATLIAATEGSPTVSTYRAMAATLVFDSGDQDAAIATLRGIVDASEPSEETRRIAVTLARMLVVTGNQVGARALIEEVLAEDTTNVDALKMRAQWQIDADDPDAAINDLRAALSQSPRDPEILTLMAAAHMRAGSPELAGERLAGAVDVSGSGTEESLRYARYLLSNGRTQPAESVLLGAERANPGNLDILALLADLWIGAKDWDRLQQIRNTLTEIGTESALALDERLATAIVLGQNRIEDAAAMLAAITSDDGRTRATIGIVMAQAQAGKLDAARAFLADALAERPDEVSLRLLDGSLAVQAGDVATAETTFRAVMADAPQTDTPIRLLFTLLTSQGRTEEATAVLRAGLERLPDSPTLLWLQAGLVEQQGDIDGAIAIYEQLYAQDSSNVLIANNLASLLADHRTDNESLDRAFAIARRLRGLENPALQDTYGWIQYRRGNYSDAVTDLETAARGLPENAMVQFHLGMVYAALDRPEPARAALSRALDLAKDSALPQFVTARETLNQLGGPPEADVAVPAQQGVPGDGPRPGE